MKQDKLRLIETVNMQQKNELVLQAAQRTFKTVMPDRYNNKKLDGSKCTNPVNSDPEWKLISSYL